MATDAGQPDSFERVWVSIASHPQRLALCCIGAGLVVEIALHWWPPEGLWLPRLTAWSVIALTANLVVLWWYAKRTEDHLRVAVAARRDANRPYVVVTRHRHLNDKFEELRLHNVGPGLAANAWALSCADGLACLESGGSIGSRDARRLPKLAFDLLDAKRPQPTTVVTIAEGLLADARWTVTATTQLPPSYLLESTPIGVQAAGCESVDDLIRENIEAFAAALGCSRDALRCLVGDRRTKAPVHRPEEA